MDYSETSDKDIPVPDLGDTCYPDLSPTDKAEHVEPYILRLNDLLRNRSEGVKEIAITSPYSGGKSSFIRTFLAKNTSLIAIQISLSSFSIGKEIKDSLEPTNVDDVPISDEDINRLTSMARVEKSILQQLLYRPDSQSTPNSRFRRIFPRPIRNGEAWFYSISIVSWLLSIFSIMSLNFLSFEGIILAIMSHPSFVGAILELNTWVLAYLVSIPLLIFRDSLRHFNQLTISKISPLKGEVSLEKKAPESIFNKYLEEIIYFFSVQKTEVVIFEDLDRFSNPIIFEKLKELNKLINDSSDVEQQVRFIYAIKDDVFTGSDRTKFFDAIIPIIPFATAANSFPELKKSVHAAGVAEKLSDEFLRDISVFLDDMRVIKNVVAEYVLYRKVLLKNLPDLEPTKLFSFVVYKNMYSRDFAKLTANSGVLYEFIQGLPKTREQLALSLKTELEDLQKALKLADDETAESIETLNARVFYLLSKQLSNNGLITHVNSQMTMDAIKSENFDKLVASEQQVTFSSSQGNVRFSNIHPKLPNSSSFKRVLSEIFPQYEARREYVLNKQKPQQAELEEKSTDLEKQLFVIRKMPISELFERYRDTLVELDCFSIKAQNCPDLSLLLYMLERGYIDEHYHYYVSHFREGSVSSTDIKFVRSVRKHENNDIDFVPHNMVETLKYFNSNDYASKSFFNVSFVNYYISHDQHTELLQHFEFAYKNAHELIELITENAKKFDQISSIVLLLVRARVDLVNELLNVRKNSDIVLSRFFTFLISALDISQLNSLREIDKLVNYLNGQEQICNAIIDYQIEIEDIFSKLQALGVKFESLHDCKSESNFLKNALIHQVFVFKYQNLEVLCCYLFEKTLHNNKTLSIEQVVEIEDSSFQLLISQHLNAIAQMVATKDVTFNDFAELEHLLLSDEVDDNAKFEIVEQLDFVIERVNKNTLDLNPELINEILLKGKIVPSSEILDSLLDKKDITNEALASYVSDFGEALSTDSDLEKLTNIAKLQKLLLSPAISFDVFKMASSSILNGLAVAEICETDDEKAESLVEGNEIEANIAIFNTIYSEYGNTHIALKLLVAHFESLQSDLATLSLNKTDFYYLFDLPDSKFPKYAKQKLVLAKHDELVDLDQDNTNLIKCLSLDENAPIYEPFKLDIVIGWDLFWKLLNWLTDEKAKVLFFLGQLSFLNNAQAMSALEYIDAELHNNIVQGKRPSKKYTPHTFLLGKGLEHHDIIASAKIEVKVLSGKEVRFYSKRSD